jgi:predicted  nucleic acid-binding Zn-ribbon protein
MTTCPVCGKGEYAYPGAYVSHIACVEKAIEVNKLSICIFCGETMEKDLAVMLDHAKGCEKRPENVLLRRAEQAEAKNERLMVALEQSDWASAQAARAELAALKQLAHDAIALLMTSHVGTAWPVEVAEAVTVLRKTQASREDRES